jgi:hypothetical protein
VLIFPELARAVDDIAGNLLKNESVAAARSFAATIRRACDAAKGSPEGAPTCAKVHFVTLPRHAVP